MSHALTTFFEPRQIAVIGASASEGKSGYVVVANILANGYEGKIYPVNPRGGEILGLPVTRSISELPEGIDVAVIILPAEQTVQALRECASRGIRNAVLLAGGFAEVDEGRAKLQEELVEVLRTTGIRTLGPNTSGHTSTPFKFTSSLFPLGKIRRGKVSFIAQTGNFATHTMKYILTGEHFGPARVIGLGNKIDVEESEALGIPGTGPGNQGNRDLRREPQEAAALPRSGPGGHAHQARRDAQGRRDRGGTQGGRRPHRRHGIGRPHRRRDAPPGRRRAHPRVYAPRAGGQGLVHAPAASGKPRQLPGPLGRHAHGPFGLLHGSRPRRSGPAAGDCPAPPEDQPPP